MSWEIKVRCTGCGKKGKSIHTDKYSMGTCVPKEWSGVGRTWDNGESIMDKVYCKKCTDKLVE